MAKLLLEKAPCCGEEATIDLGDMGRVSSIRRECPNCGRWVGLMIETYVAFPPGQLGIAWRMLPDGGAELTTLAPRDVRPTPYYQPMPDPCPTCGSTEVVVEYHWTARVRGAVIEGQVRPDYEPAPGEPTIRAYCAHCERVRDEDG